jgi:2-dehydro-3-deoxygluconokinase
MRVLAGASTNVACGVAHCYRVAAPKKLRLKSAIVSMIVDDGLGYDILTLAESYGAETEYVHLVQTDNFERLENVQYEMSRPTSDTSPARASWFYRANGPVARLCRKDCDINWEKTLSESETRVLFGDFILASLDRFKKREDGTLSFLLEGFETARRLGVKTAFDTNYRASLWNDLGGMKEAANMYLHIMPHVDILTGNLGHFAAILGQECDPNKLSEEAIADPKLAEGLIRKLVSHYPHLKVVATAIRHEMHARRHNWKVGLYANGEFHWSPLLDNMRVIDRPGTGDAVTAQILAGVCLEDAVSPQEVVNRAWANGSLQASRFGDASRFTLAEIDEEWTNFGLSGEERNRAIMASR